MNSYQLFLNKKESEDGRSSTQIAMKMPNSFLPPAKTEESMRITRERNMLASYGGAVNLGNDWVSQLLTGDKFVGGFGATKLFTPDYWTLRKRSAQLFHENIYARGLIRRLITNEINTGLTLEATPNSKILGIDEDTLNTWSDDVEDRFSIWAETPDLCDFKGEDTFGQIQRKKRAQAIVSGDVLVVYRFDKNLKMPRIQLIPGDDIKTPLGVSPRQGNTIKLGVELDKNNRQVAYWTSENGKAKRIPAFGEKSGRRLAKLVYGSDMLIDEVRGMPLLGICLQSLKELDRYRDAELRAAVVNSMVAAWVEKNEDKPGTRPFSGGAVRTDTIDQSESANDADTQVRDFTLSSQLPGFVAEELQQGEKLQSYDTSRPNVNYGTFESAVAHALAWCHEVPPEVFLLAFNNNYSASRAAINEFKMYLNKARSDEASDFCKPVYKQWLIAEVLTGRIDAPGLLEAWRNPDDFTILGAWISSDWGGAIKPSVDLKKEVEGYRSMIEGGLITNDRASKELTGQKFTKNMQRLKREEELKTELMVAKLRPLLELQREFGVEAVSAAMDQAGIEASHPGSDIDDLADNVVHLIDQNSE